MPAAPPNTEKSSAAASAKPSAPHTRPPSEEHFPLDDHIQEVVSQDESDPDDQPLELRVRATFSRPPAARRHASDPTSQANDYLSVPIHQRSSDSHSPPSPCSGQRNAQKHTRAISRQLSNLAVEDAHFRTHRDSLELMRWRESIGEGNVGVNQELMSTRDSFVLTRARVGRKARESERDLSPIVDASPPGSVEFLPLSGAGKKKQREGVVGQGQSKGPVEVLRRGEDQGGKGGAPLVGEDGHPNEHVDCPIYEVERPRWFEAKFGRKLGT